MAIFKNTIFANWHFMRLLRLALGIYVGVQTVMIHNFYYGIIASFFIFQAITNTGCCGTEGCVLPSRDLKNDDESRKIHFEEIKN